MRRRVAVIGGGITGLAAANRLTELDPSLEVQLLEAGKRVGGVLETSRKDGFLMESAADGFLTSLDSAINLCTRLGLEDELIAPDESCRQALVLNRGRLLAVPAGFHLMAPGRLWPVLSSPLFSVRGKLRAALEFLLPARSDDDDESLQSFVCRRFGREVFDNLVQPLVGGIYAGDPGQLGIEATFPRFREMERQHGSLIRAMLHREREGRDCGGARYGQFKTPRGGMGAMVSALAARLPRHSIVLNSPVSAVIPQDKNRWRVEVDGTRSSEVDGVIIATPAHRAARLIEQVGADSAGKLRDIEYASCAVVSLGYRREQIGHALNGFGFVVPLAERRLIISCSFASVKYSERAPQGCVLLRVFVGGACQSGLLRLSRQELGELAAREVSDVLHIRGEPVVRNVVRQHKAMPQYVVGHRERVARIEAGLQRFRTLALAGSALYGVGVPRCIHSGEAAAEKIHEQLQGLCKSTERMGPRFAQAYIKKETVLCHDT